MTTLFGTLTSVHTSDPELRRRGQILISLSLGVLAILLLVALLGLLRRPDLGDALNLAIGGLIFTAAATLGRYGHVNAGAFLLIISSIIGSASGSLIHPEAHLNLFYLVLSVLLASVLLPPRQIWAVLVVCLLAIVAVGVAIPPEMRAAAAWIATSRQVPLLLCITTLIAFLGARSGAQALAAASEARRQAEEVGSQLAASKVTLEARVEERTAALRQIADEHRAAAVELQSSLQAQQELNRIVAEMSVPIIPVSADTLVVPLVGTIDSARARQILDAILGRVEQTRARTVVLDVTGVAIVDTHVAAALLRVAQGTSLMGARTILAGIRPEVAEAIVGLGVDLNDLHTVATLQEAL